VSWRQGGGSGSGLFQVCRRGKNLSIWAGFCVWRATWGTHEMGGSQTSPVRPFVKSNAKMMSTEHWCNDRPGEAVVQFVFGKEGQTINVLQKIMAVHCENHMENSTGLL
jgi:hypothetical protein